MNFWAQAKRLSYTMSNAEFEDLVTKLELPVPSPMTCEQFRHIYREHVCDVDGWPSALPITSGNKIAEGIKVKSLSGAIEGRTTGNRRKCLATSTQCPGWFIEVIWETGQRMWPCSEGWHYDLNSNQIFIVGGGEISARFISPKPLGTHPEARNNWPTKRELAKMRGWRVSA